MNLQTNTVRKNYKLPKQRHKTTQVYLMVGMGHHALVGRAPLLEVGELWLNGRMEERESEWLERQNGLKALTQAT